MADIEYGEDTRDRLRASIEWCESGIRDCNEKMAGCFREIDDLTVSRENYEREKEEYEIHLAQQELQFASW